MARQITLSLGEDSARLVTIERRKVVSWSSISLNPSLSTGSPEAIGQQVGRLLRAADIQSRRVIVEFHNPSVLTRHLKLPQMPRRYMPQVVAKEVAETLPFAMDEVDLSWQAFSNNKGWQALTFCIPREVIDTHVQMLRAASIRSFTIYPRSLALVHAVAERDAVILNLEPDAIEIMLVLQGTPLVTYQPRASLSNDGREEALQTLAAEVERLVEFAQPAASGELNSVVVVPTGKLADHELIAHLRKAFSREIRPFKPLFDVPGDFPASEYAANLGLALAASPRSRAGFPSINVLPARHRPAPFPWWPAAVFSLLLAMMAAAPVLTQRVAERGASVATISRRLSSLQSQARQERLRLGEASALQQNTERTRLLTQQLEAQFQGLASSRSSLIRHIETVATDAVPDGVKLTSMSYGNGKLGLQAQALSYYHALQYVAQLRASDAFQKVTLDKAQASTQGIAFQITVTYQDKGARAPP